MTLKFDFEEFIPVKKKGIEIYYALKTIDQNRYLQGNENEVFNCFFVNEDGTLSNKIEEIVKYKLESATVRAL